MRKSKDAGCRELFGPAAPVRAGAGAGGDKGILQAHPVLLEPCRVCQGGTRAGTAANMY